MEQYDWADKPSSTAFPIAKAGYPFIYISAFTTIVFAFLGLTILALTTLFITFSICFFFRDPDRVIPNQEGAVISPADGKVIIVNKEEDSPYFSGPCYKISIFMTVFNVHVNRVVHGGKIIKTVYHPGKFLSADLDKASLSNEQNAIFLQTDSGRDICIVQIAGLIARRIICNVQKGDQLKRGQRFGLICFGSRLDVYLPPDFNTTVSVGEKVKAGTSIIGYLK